jgi:hypothetical protein
LRIGEEQNDEWQLQHRYMQVEVMAELDAAAGAADHQSMAVVTSQDPPCGIESDLSSTVASAPAG